MSTNKNVSPDNDSLIISYLTLRKAVGILGMILPFILLAGYILFEKDCVFPPSISHFYYTGLGNYFVGTLCAVSLFLFSYNGYNDGDKWVAKLAGLFAILVALFPTNFNGYGPELCSRIAASENDFSNIVHYTAATLLFSAFAWFSLVLFTKTKKDATITPQKIIRNGIYRTCGWVIIVCIIGIALFSFIPSLYNRFKLYKPTYVLETFALLAFGFSWLIKGETFFMDKKPKR